MNARLLVILLASSAIAAGCNTKKNSTASPSASANPVQILDDGQQGGGDQQSQQPITLVPSGDTASSSTVSGYDISILNHEDATPEEEAALLEGWTDVTRDLAFVESLTMANMTTSGKLDLYSSEALRTILGQRAATWHVQASNLLFLPTSITSEMTGQGQEAFISKLSFMFNACQVSIPQDPGQQPTPPQQPNPPQQPPTQPQPPVETCITVTASVILTPVVEPPQQP